MKLKHPIIYGIIGSLGFASSIALVDFFRDKEFELLKFILGIFIFGIAMFFTARINNKKDE